MSLEENKFPLPPLDNTGIKRREELPSYQRFVKLCEECDYVYFGGMIGFYDKRRMEIVVQSSFIVEYIQIDKCEGEFDGEYWYITDTRKSPYTRPWRIQFLKIMNKPLTK